MRFSQRSGILSWLRSLAAAMPGRARTRALPSASTRTTPSGFIRDDAHGASFGGRRWVTPPPLAARPRGTDEFRVVVRWPSSLEHPRIRSSRSIRSFPRCLRPPPAAGVRAPVPRESSSALAAAQGRPGHFRGPSPVDVIRSSPDVHRHRRSCFPFDRSTARPPEPPEVLSPLRRPPSSPSEARAVAGRGARALDLADVLDLTLVRRGDLPPP